MIYILDGYKAKTRVEIRKMAGIRVKVALSLMGAFPANLFLQIETRLR